MFSRIVLEYGVTMLDLSKIDCFDLEDIPEKGAFLLACIRRDSQYEHYCKILREIQRRYADRLKVGALDEKALETYRRLGIEGTPTFLIFQNRMELARILGRTNLERLGCLVGKAFPIMGAPHDNLSQVFRAHMDQKTVPLK